MLKGTDGPDDGVEVFKVPEFCKVETDGRGFEVRTVLG